MLQKELNLQQEQPKNKQRKKPFQIKRSEQQTSDEADLSEDKIQNSKKYHFSCAIPFPFSCGITELTRCGLLSGRRGAICSPARWAGSSLWLLPSPCSTPPKGGCLRSAAQDHPPSLKLITVPFHSLFLMLEKSFPGWVRAQQ